MIMSEAFVILNYTRVIKAVQYNSENDSWTTWLSTLKKDIPKVSKDAKSLFKELDSGKLKVTDWQGYCNSVEMTDKSLIKFLTDTEYSEKTLANYQQYLKKSSESMTLFQRAGKAAGTAMKSLGATLLSMGVTWLAGEALSLAITGIDHLANAAKYEKQALEDATEAAKKYADQIKTTKEENEKNAKSANDIAEKYAKLAQGVDVNTNKNKFLSNDDYEEFLNLNKQLADLFPTLTKGYDENGNAILGLSGGVDTVTESIRKLVEQQERLAKQDLKDSLEKYVNGDGDSKGQLKVIEGQKKKVDDLNEQMKSTKKIYDSLMNGKTVGNQNGIGASIFNQILDGTDIDRTKIDFESLYGDGKAIDFSKLELSEDEKRQITESWKLIYGDIVSESETAKSELDNNNKELSQQMMVWVEDLDFYKENSSLQTPLMDFVQNVDWASLGLTDYDQVKSYIQKNILTPLQTACKDPDAKNKILSSYASLFSVDFSKMSFKEANKKIQELFKNIILAMNPDANKEEIQKKMLDMYNVFGLGDYDKSTVNMKNNLESIAKDNTDDFEKLTNYTKTFNQEQVQAWLSATKDAKNAEEAIKKYETSLEKSKKSSSDEDTFSSVWDDKNNKSTRTKLEKLAKSGTLSKETIKSVEAYKNMWKSTNLSLDDFITKIKQTLSLQDKVKMFSKDTKGVAKAYKDYKKNGYVSSESLNAMPDSFKQLDGYTKFNKTVRDKKASSSSKQGAFNDLVSEYLETNKYLEDLSTETSEKMKKKVATALKDAGVTNAEALVDYYTSEEKLLKESTDELEKKDDKDLENYVNMLNNKGTKTADVNNQIGESNGQLFATLSKQYKNDLDNWVEALKEKKRLYNEFVDQLKGAEGKTTNEKFKNAVTTMSGKKKGQSASSYVSGLASKQLQYQQASDKEKKAKDTVNFDLKKIKGNYKVDYKPTSASGNGSKKSSSGSNKDTNKVIDWIERRLNHLNSTIDYTTSKLQNMFTLKKKSNEIDKQIKTSTKLINAYGIAADKYKKKANQVAKPSTKTVTNSKGKKKKKKVSGLSDTLIKNIQNGRLKGKSLSKLIATYGEDKAEKIQSYQDYWDKYQDARKNKQDEIAKKRQYQMDQIQLDIDNFSEISTINDAKKENAKSANEKNSILDNEINNLGKYYDSQKKLVQVQYGKKSEKALNELARLEEERKKKLNDIAIEQHQNVVDELDRSNEALEAQKQNLKTAAEKNAVIEQQKPIVAKTYAEQIAIAKLQYGNNSDEVKKLQEEYTTKLNELAIEQHQNTVDELDRNNEALEAQKQNLKTASEKNAIVEQQKAIAKQTYAEQIAIAKLQYGEGSDEVKKLQEEQKSKLADFENEKFENIQTEYSNWLDMIQARIDGLDGSISIVEAKGITATQSLYQGKVDIEKENLSTLQAEKAALEEQHKSTEVGTALWYAQEKTLNDVSTAIINAQKNMIEYRNSIREANDQVLELKKSFIDLGNVYLDNFEKYLSRYSLTDEDTGGLTDKGVTALGIYRKQSISAGEQQKIDMDKLNEIEDIIARYNIYDDTQKKILLEANNYDSFAQVKEDYEKYAQAVQDDISNRISAEENIINLMKERYNAELSYIQKLIDDRKQQLSDEKDLYDYQKSIQEKVDNVSLLQKQLDALRNDGSEEAMQRRNSIQDQLDNAKEDLMDVEYDKYISDQQNMLDQLSEDYQNLIEDLLQDVDTLLNEGNEIAKNNGDRFETAINNFADKYNETTFTNQQGDVAKIKDAVEKEQKDQEAANEVLSAIEKIGTVDLDGEGRKRLVDAEELYKSLTDAQRKIVDENPNGLELLNKKRQEWEALQKPAPAPEPTPAPAPEQSATEAKREEERKNQQKAQFEKLIGELYIGMGGKDYGTSKLYKDNGKETDYTKVQKRIATKYKRDDKKYVNASFIRKICSRLGITQSAGSLLNYMNGIGFSKGGIVETLSKVPGRNGDDGWATLKRGEAILTPEQTKMFQSMIKQMPVFTNAMDIFSSTKSSTGVNNKPNSVSVGDINLTLDLPNVTNPESFVKEMQSNTKMRKAVQQAVFDEVTGKGSFNIKRL